MQTAELLYVLDIAPRKIGTAKQKEKIGVTTFLFLGMAMFQRETVRAEDADGHVVEC
jgi:hypothetical protein